MKKDKKLFMLALDEGLKKELITEANKKGLTIVGESGLETC